LHTEAQNFWRTERL
jgi:hypothetical protein